jgi:hypothetical protein
VDPSDTSLDALTGIISLMKKLSREEQERTFQAVATFLNLSSNVPSKASHQDAVSKGAGSDSAPVGAFSENRNLSAKEFLRDKGPTTDVDRVACLGYYLAHYRGIQHFKTLDISTLNTEAAYPKFSNAAMAVDNATKAGLLVQAVKGSKQMSAAGERYVQTLPDRDTARSALAGVRKKRRSRKVVVRAAEPGRVGK